MNNIINNVDNFSDQHIVYFILVINVKSTLIWNENRDYPFEGIFIKCYSCLKMLNNGHMMKCYLEYKSVKIDE